MKTVIIRGPAVTKSGYGRHCRDICRYFLNKPNVECKFILTPWGNTPWNLDKDEQDGLIGEIMDRSSAPDSRGDLSVQVQLPNEWSQDLAPTNIGVSAVVETDRCHPMWVESCNKMSRVIVPSKHVAATLTNTGNVTAPLHVVHESFTDACMKDVKSLDVSLPPFTFLVFGQLTGANAATDRKNTFNTIKWLCETFADKEDVGIVLKTNMGRNSKIDRTQTMNMLKSAIAEIRKGTFPRITLLHGDMSDEEVVGLYKHPNVKALVSLTRGEGYGLPTCEAAACGLPIIATGWSGHMDFLGVGKFINVGYTLQQIDPARVDNQIFVKEARWADVHENDAKAKFMKFYQKSSTPREWAKDLQVKVQEKFSFDSICKQYDAVLGDLL